MAWKDRMCMQRMYDEIEWASMQKKNNVSNAKTDSNGKTLYKHGTHGTSR